jgi:hypothetical protein
MKTDNGAPTRKQIENIKTKLAKSAQLRAAKKIALGELSKERKERRKLAKQQHILKLNKQASKKK